MVVADGQGVPLGELLDAASPAEVKLVEKTLAQVAVPRKGRGRPRSKFPRLIYDKACDSDPLRKRLKKRASCAKMIVTEWNVKRWLAENQ